MNTDSLNECAVLIADVLREECRYSAEPIGTYGFRRPDLIAARIIEELNKRNDNPLYTQQDEETRGNYWKAKAFEYLDETVKLHSQIDEAHAVGFRDGAAKAYASAQPSEIPVDGYPKYKTKRNASDNWEVRKYLNADQYNYIAECPDENVADMVCEALSRTTEPVLVSLEKCAKAVAVEIGEPHEDDIRIAKAVLDAAGVKYE